MKWPVAIYDVARRCHRGTAGAIPGADDRFDANDVMIVIDQFFSGC